MTTPILRIKKTTLQPGGEYTIPFFIGGLTEKPVLYFVNKKKHWIRIKPSDIDGNNRGEFEFQKTFKSKRHGNIPFTFYLFVKQGNRLSCYKATGTFNMPKDSSAVNHVTITATEGGAVYTPEMRIGHLQSETEEALSIPFVDKEEFNQHLPVGNRGEKPAARWRLKFPDGKETVLLTNNPVTVGGRSKYAVFFKGADEEYLYSAVMPNTSPLHIRIENTGTLVFSHQSSRRIKVNQKCNPFLLPKDEETYFGAEQSELLFEYFMPLNIERATPRTLGHWRPKSDVPPEVLYELLYPERNEAGELPPPLHLSTANEHPLNEHNRKRLAVFINDNKHNAEDRKKLADSFEYFKRNPDNRYAHRDYYFAGSGFQLPLPGGMKAAVLTVGKHVYLIFDEDTVCKTNGMEFDLNAGQPVMLTDGLEIHKGEKFFTAEHFYAEKLAAV
jgi:hypothetical protein